MSDLSNTARTDRAPNALRPVSIETGTSPYAEGSCTIAFGNTLVLCTASVEPDVPPWRRGSGEGWVTAEYAMLPRSTHTRSRRERANLGGRTQEIQRLIGRALRASIDLKALGERAIIIDCDVLVADGGTRTAAITGGAVALHLAVNGLIAQGLLTHSPIRQMVAAISVGIVRGEPRLDLEYREDVAADVDMNLVALEDETLVEVQGTAEHNSFSRPELDQLIELGLGGIRTLLQAQKRALGL